MSQTFEFFDARAREAAADAEDATLDRVRERALRSEAAWRQMAIRAQVIEGERAKAAEARAEHNAAQQPESHPWT